jgi:hypothetical protein
MNSRQFFTETRRRCHEALLANFLASTDGQEEMDRDTADQLAQTARWLAHRLTDHWVIAPLSDRS